MFENNGTYNLFAMASAARVRPGAPRGYIVENHQPCGPVEDESPFTLEQQIAEAPLGSFWKTRHGEKMVLLDKHATDWAGRYPIRMGFLPHTEGAHIDYKTTGHQQNETQLHDRDIVGPWVD